MYVLCHGVFMSWEMMRNACTIVILETEFKISPDILASGFFNTSVNESLYFNIVEY